MVQHSSVSSEARERVKKKLVNAARLIVAFRPAQKGKVVVGKDGIANESIAFAIKSVQQETTTTNIATATTALKKDPVSERPPVVNRARSMSLMTDSVDDSPRGTENGIPTPTSMQQQQPPTIFSGRRANETPRRTVEPLAASKQNLFDFKPPEEVASKQLLAKKSTGSFLSKLKERVGKDKADLVEQLVEAAEEDDDSVVTSYFDHNAAPIFVEREKVEKHVLHSKRFDKPLEGKEYRSKYGVGEDDESVDEGTCPIDGYTGGRARSRSESGPRQDVHADQQDHYQEGGERDFDGAEGADGAFNGARFAAGSSKSGKAATAAKVIIKPQFDLGKFLNGVSEEERVALEGLPQEAVNQIMEGMNVRSSFPIRNNLIWF